MYTKYIINDFGYKFIRINTTLIWHIISTIITKYILYSNLFIYLFKNSIYCNIYNYDLIIILIPS